VAAARPRVRRAARNRERGTGGAAVRRACELHVVHRRPTKRGVLLTVVAEISAGGRTVAPVHFGLQRLELEHTGAGRWRAEAMFRRSPEPLATCLSFVETTEVAVVTGSIQFLLAAAAFE
jgi:hypothetical protein